MTVWASMNGNEAPGDRFIVGGRARRACPRDLVQPTGPGRVDRLASGAPRSTAPGSSGIVTSGTIAIATSTAATIATFTTTAAASPGTTSASGQARVPGDDVGRARPARAHHLGRRHRRVHRCLPRRHAVLADAAVVVLPARRAAASDDVLSPGAERADRVDRRCHRAAPRGVGARGAHAGRR